MNTESPEPPPTDANADEAGPRFPRWLKWGLIGALAAAVLFYGGILVYTNFIKDSPEAFGESDLESALESDATTDTTPDTTGVPATDTPATEPPATEPPATEVPGTDAPATDAPVTTEAADGAAVGAQEWVVTSDSELGYRVKEILFGVDTEGVGRTNQIEGSFTIDGTQVTEGQFVVDVASITSDESRRDSQFRGRIMSTDEFPEAVFTLTEPIELGTEPVEGASVSTSATGELTLRGTTNPVTFDLEARLENGRIGVLGDIPVVFEDYGVPNPSTAGVTTEDNGLLEFVLVFEPA